MEVDKDDAGQHSLGSQHQALRNLKSVNFNSVFTKYIENLCVKKILLQCSSKSLDTDAFVGVCFGFFFKYLWQIYEEDADPKCDEEDNDR